MFNHGEEPFKVEKGDKIAQMIFEKIVKAELEVVEQLEETERGQGGFGSTDEGNIKLCSIQELEFEDIELAIEFQDIETLMAATEMEEIVELTAVEIKEAVTLPEQYKEFEEVFKSKEIGEMPP